MELFNDTIIWWVTVIEVPVITALFWLMWRTRENLNDFKLDVAKTYASHTDLRELETRLVEHLLRIEMKLDKTALKAAENAALKRPEY